MNPESTCRLLFVYGTLRQGSGHAMAAFLAQRSHFLSPARVPGRLFDLGRFPGMLPPETNDDWVIGDLLELAEVQATLADLDRYEDDEGIFPRRLTTALLPDGGERETWVYFYAGPLHHARRIASGDYLKRTQEKAS